jgi:hypothetical protein
MHALRTPRAFCATQVKISPNGGLQRGSLRINANSDKHGVELIDTFRINLGQALNLVPPEVGIGYQGQAGQLVRRRA